MKPVSLKIAVVFCCLGGLLVAVGPAWAHGVNVFAWVEGATVYVQGKFASGKKVKAGKIVVMDLQGNELHSGLTNDRGEYSFKTPKRAGLKIVLITGHGHRAQWIIPADEIDGPPPATDTTGASTAARQLPKSTDTSRPSKGVNQEISTPQLSLQELEAVVETVLDKKLKPITKMLADAQHKGPTVGDIFAGIGYIMGLVGVAAYVQSRKKKA